jgi:hypothetical protein
MDKIKVEAMVKKVLMFSVFDYMADVSQNWSCGYYAHIGERFSVLNPLKSTGSVFFFK